MYVSGIGRTKFGTLDKTIPELAYAAMYAAIEDSGIHATELDAIYVGNFCAESFARQLHLNSVIAGLLPGMNKPIIRVETACAASSSATYQAILSEKKNVLVVGVEKMSEASGKEATEYLSRASDRTLDQKSGLIFPGNYALIAQQHMREYGTTADDLALVSLKNHENGNLNLLAHFNHKKVDLEMIKTSPMVCTPLRLFDCCPFSDGATALVLSKEKRNDRDIKIAGSAMATDAISLVQRETLTSFKAAKIATKEALEQAGMNIKNIGTAEVHDCFTIAEMIAMEDIGICGPGESKDWIREGRTKIGGDIPINTDGGLKADGHPIGATGAAQIYEVVTQLRGEAGKRQVDAEAGLTHNIGGIGGTAVVHIFKRD